MRIERDLTLTDQIVEALRTSIVTGELSPHDLHSVQSITDKLEQASGTTLSRTPVREALVRLAEAGMVRFERNRGIRIVRPGARDLQEIFQLRLMVEPPATFRAARRIDQAALRKLALHLEAMNSAATARDLHGFMDHDIAFHNLILQVDGNERLIRLIRNLRDTTRTLGLEGLLEGATDLQNVMQQHEPVLIALTGRNAEAAAAEMYGHIEQTGLLLLRQIGRHGEQGRLDDWREGIAGPEGVDHVHDRFLERA